MFYANSEPILYEPRKSRKSRKFRRCESLTTSIDDNDLDSYRLIASLKETQLDIRDRGAEKWWAKKWKTWALMALFFCPPFFCPFKSPAVISIDVNMPLNVNAFHRDQNVVKHWMLDARTTPFIEWRQVKFLKVEAADPPLRCNGLVCLAYRLTCGVKVPCTRTSSR